MSVVRENLDVLNPAGSNTNLSRTTELNFFGFRESDRDVNEVNTGVGDTIYTAASGSTFPSPLSQPTKHPTFGGTYSGVGTVTYKVEISNHTSTPNKFKWYKDGVLQASGAETDITSGTMDSAFSKASKNPTKYVFMKAGQPHFKYKGQAVPFALATEEENVVLDMMPRTKKNQGGKSFPDLTGDGKVTQADVLKGRGVFAEGSEVNEQDMFRRQYEQYKKELAAAKDEEARKEIMENFQMQTQNIDSSVKMKVLKEMDRKREADGGSMLVPPEMEDMPVDTYTPEEQANAEATQLPDSEMEDNYMDFVLDESLQADEQEYLMNALEADPKLNSIIDKVIMTASEFSGAGEVEGPGTGVSDSIPARLSDGEFVITEKATDEIGADNLHRRMDAGERMSDGGEARYGLQMGGMLANPMAMKQEDPELMDDPMQQTEEEINKSMMQANRIPSLMGAYR